MEFRKLRSALVAVFGLAALTGCHQPAENAAPSAPKTVSSAASAGGAGASAPVRLITQEQYVNTLRAVFGNDIRYPTRLAPIKRVSGLVALGASSAIVTGGALDQFDAAARSIAAQVVDEVHRKYLIGCSPASDVEPDDACAEQFLSRAGSLLYRRPLTRSETDLSVKVAHESAVKLKGFYPGLSAALSGLLVSPEFLFINQDVEIDRKSRKPRLTAHSKAVKLSLLLWNAYPDEELLFAAKTGAINTKEGLAQEVDRMLASPRLDQAVRNFFEDMLLLDGFEILVKDPVIYPSFTSKVINDAREETLKNIVAHTVRDDADYRDLFVTRKTFLTGDLASIYNVPVARPLDWGSYEFAGDSPRQGILTQLGFLAVYAHPGRSSATRRGRAVREIFLCQKVPEPPPNVDFTGFEAAGKVEKTARGRLDAHNANPICAGCHKITDPIGLALENFDGAGRFRTEDNGERIDASGVLDGKTFQDAAGLGVALRDHPGAPACLVTRVLSYALGRPLSPGDNSWQTSIRSSFAANGYRIRTLMKEIATSDNFYEIGQPS